MAVLSVVVAALAPAWIGTFSSLPSAVALFPATAAIGLLLLCGLSSVVTAAYVLPMVAVGHWFGDGQGKRWQVGGGQHRTWLLPAGLPMIV